MNTKPWPLALLLAGFLALGGCARRTEPSPPAPSAHASTSAPAARPAAGSLYDVELALRDQAGAPLRLDAFRGHPVIVSMFYASCPYACPTLISDIQRLEQRLGKDTRLDVRVLLVSLDPERDTPSALLALASKRGIDTTRWSLTVTDEASVRTLAAALGVKYRKLESGEFNHTSVISVLGRDGSILSQSEGLNASNDELLRTLAEMSKPPT